MPEYFLFLILLIAALSHAICHSLLKHNDNPLGLLGITSICEIIIFTVHCAKDPKKFPAFGRKLINCPCA